MKWSEGHPWRVPFVFGMLAAMGRALVESGLIEPCYRGLPGYRAYVATFNDGRVARQEEFYDHAEALEAVGAKPRRVPAT